MDQKIRARNFEARNERLETGVLVNARSKGKLVRKEARRMLSMHSESTAHKKETATMSINWKKQRNRPLLLQSRRLNVTGKIL